MMVAEQEVIRRAASRANKISPYFDFDEAEFLRCLLTEANMALAIGDVLLDSRIAVDVGPRRRTEILAASHIDPCQLVGDLSAHKLESLCRAVARIARHSDYS